MFRGLFQSIFIMTKVGNLLKKITDPMTIMIRVAKRWLDVSDFCENLQDFSIFLDCPPRILGGFTWRLQKEPPISNNKILYDLPFQRGATDSFTKVAKQLYQSSCPDFSKDRIDLDRLCSFLGNSQFSLSRQVFSSSKGHFYNKSQS